MRNHGRPGRQKDVDLSGDPDVSSASKLERLICIGASAVISVGLIAWALIHFLDDIAF